MSVRQETADLLSVRDLCASNQKSEILHHLNFAMQAGEIHAVVGTSEFYLQCFLDALAGRITITSGGFAFQGQPCMPEQLVKDKITFVCQETRLFNGFTAINNIYINDRMFYRASNRKKRELAETFRQMFDLDIDLNQDVFFLTAEERKIVEVLRAYQLNAPVAVLHDTSNFINSNYILCLRRILQQMVREGKGVLYATTNMEDAMSFSKRISILDNGQIKGVFDTKQAIENPREIISRISGWERLDAEAREEVGMNAKMYDALMHSREISTSSFEIKSIIHAQSIDFRQALSADGCVIYLIDEDVNGIIDSLYPEEADATPRLSGACIRTYTRENEEIVLSKQEPAYESHFVSGAQQASTVFGVSVFSNGKQIGFVQIWYREPKEYSAKRFRYINNFAREVAVAVETSRLMGFSVLLQESHHRIKNNLQIIINLVYMQKARLMRSENGELDVGSVLDAVIERVKSIAVVHDMFSTNQLGRGMINLRPMAEKLLKMYSATGISYQLRIDDVGIPYSKATSIALVINELLSNCVKHAFPDGWEDRRVNISCQHESGDILLRVQDNGVGLPEGFDPSGSDSLGISIMQTIVESFYGTLTFQNDHGVSVIIRMPARKMYS